jgi:flagellar biosynthesis GTPase FlhF
MKKINIKDKKIMIIAAVVAGLLVAAVAGYFIYANSFKEDNGINTEENTAEDQAAEENEEPEEEAAPEEEATEEEPAQTPAEIYEYTSQVFEAKSTFNKLEVIWDSLNTVKEEKIIFIKVYNNNAWSGWKGYPLALDPATKNSTYKATITGITGTKMQYAFNFSNNNEVIRGLLIRVFGTETENISIDEIRK